MCRKMLNIIVVLLALMAGLSVAGSAPPVPPVSDELPAIAQGDASSLRNIAEIVVAMKSRDELNPKPLSEEWQRRIAEAAGVPLEYVRVGALEWHILRLPHRMSYAEADEVCARIRKLPEILHAHPSVLVVPLLVPVDPDFSNSQWNL